VEGAVQYYFGSLLDGLKETANSHGQNIKFYDRHLNPGPPQYDPAVLTLDHDIQERETMHMKFGTGHCP
jgi:hypothetical protein